jgi:hypothetical protein
VSARGEGYCYGLPLLFAKRLVRDGTMPAGATLQWCGHGCLAWLDEAEFAAVRELAVLAARQGNSSRGDRVRGSAAMALEWLDHHEVYRRGARCGDCRFFFPGVGPQHRGAWGSRAHLAHASSVDSGLRQGDGYCARQGFRQAGWQQWRLSTSITQVVVSPSNACTRFERRDAA